MDAGTSQHLDWHALPDLLIPLSGYEHACRHAADNFSTKVCTAGAVVLLHPAAAS
jgi:hypothetical protein